MSELYLEYNQDFVLTPGGDLQLATGWDEARQNIERLLFTNFRTFIPGSNSPVSPDYVFHPTYGIGLRVFVGQNMLPSVINQLEQKCLQAVLANPAVASTPAPSVKFVMDAAFHLLDIYIGVTLADGTPGQLALELSP